MIKRCQIVPFIHLMRLDKPIGTMLVLWPVLWALWLANQGMPCVKLLAIFILGAFFMRSAGCVINDIFDYQFDKFVTRTQMRPLAQNQLSMRQAFITFFVLLFLALLLVLQLNTLTLVIAIIAAALTVFYPLCKRFTHLPQVVLGLTFNAGVLMSFSASHNQLPVLAWILYLTSVIWTVAFDTLYAMVDKNDDIKIGIKSTAVLFGRHDLLLTGVLFFLFFCGLGSIGYLARLNPLFYLSVFLAFAWTYYHLYLVRLNKDKVYFKAFLANNITGMLVFIGIFTTFLTT